MCGSAVYEFLLFSKMFNYSLFRVDIMSFYLLEDKEHSIKFYGRRPEEIVETIQHYHERYSGLARKRSALPIYRRIPDPEELMQVARGNLFFSHGTFVFKRREGLSERLLVLRDFEVGTDLQSIEHLIGLRERFLSLKRGPLYKVQSSRFRSTTYIPEDVMVAIREYDFNHLLFRADEERRALG